MMIHEKKNQSKVTSVPKICFYENKQLKVMTHDQTHALHLKQCLEIFSI